MSSAPTSFVGSAYGAQFAQNVGDILENVPDLWFPQSVWVYSKMQHDPKLRGILSAYVHPIRSAVWCVDPAGCRPEVAQLVADDLGLPILGADRSPSPARRRGVSWDEHLRVSVGGHLVYGFYPSEKRYDYPDGPRGQARLVELAERVPASIARIEVDSQGNLLQVYQDTTRSTPMTRDRLVWYVHEKEGANWSGKSLLRAAYGAWLLKHEMWRVHGTSIRRFGMGVPSVEAAPGAQTPELIQAQQLASAMRVGETSGVGLPPGFKLSLTGITGSVPDALGFIRYLDEQMATMALSGILDLGSTPNGSRALGDVFMDILIDAVQSIGNQIAATATTDLAVQMVDYNWGEDEPAPRIVCGDIAADGEATIEMINSLLQSGALTADPVLEEYLRKRYKLPEKEDVPAPPVATPLRAVPSVPAVAAGRFITAGGAGTLVNATAGTGSLRRDPTNVEAAATTDFVKLQAEWETELDKLVKAWGSISAAQVDEVVAQVEDAVRSGDQAALASMTVDTSDAAARLEESMISVAEAAVEEQRAEASRQGVNIPPTKVDTSSLSTTASTVTALMGAGLVSYAARSALVTWGSPSTDASAAVRGKLEGLTEASLRDNLGGGLTMAQNSGRITAMNAGPAPQVLAASEINDGSACDACIGIDGYIYPTMAEAEADYISGGYVECLGGLRCRGILVAVYDESAIQQVA